MAVPTSISDLSVIADSNSPAGTDTATSSTGPDDYIRALAALVRREQAKGANVASAATVDLGAIADGNYIHITGTTTITGFGTVAAGIERTLVFDGALTLTHNATSLILPGAANITTVAGDSAVFVSEGAGNWRCVAYLRASAIVALNGANSDITSMTALTAPTVAANPVRATDIQTQTVTAFTTGGTSTAFTLTPSPAISALAAGQRFRVKFNATAGVAPTLAISGMAATALKLYDSAGAKVAASATSIVANMLTDVEYDGVDMVILDPLPGPGMIVASIAEIKTGTDSAKGVTPAGLFGAVGFSELAESTEISITNSTWHSFTHGLGVVPKFIECVLRCKTADLGYSVNDEIILGGIGDTSSLGGAQIYKNATVAKVFVSSATYIYRADTGVGATPTLSSWKIVMKAFG